MLPRRHTAVAVLIAAIASVTPAGLAEFQVAGEKKPQDQAAQIDAALKRSANNLRQIALALINYADTNGGRMPPATVSDKAGKPLYSWRVLILPFLEEDRLYREFKLDEPWDSPNNKKLLARMPRVYAPVLGKTKAPHSTYYQLFVGKEAPFQAGRITRFPASFQDGTSNTILVTEGSEAVLWSKPGDLQYERDKPLPKLGGAFPDRFPVVAADGAVIYVKKDFDEQMMRLAIMPSDGQVMDWRKLSP